MKVLGVYTPHGSGEREPLPVAGNQQDNPRAVRPLEHYSCGVVSLLFIGMLTVVLYPVLVSIMMPLGMFATTALVLTVAFIWGIGWIGAELLWEWRAGRWLPL